jgi:glutathione S-transferase
MKLYLSPGACSLSSHIMLQESGAKFETEQVDLKTKVTKSGANYRDVNPKGSVPALQLDNGEVLTEAAIIAQYVADKNPGAKLAPAAGTPERYRLQEWLNYVASEVHKGFSPLFNPKAPDEWKAVVKDIIATRFEYLSGALKDKAYLMGDAFSAADAYLFTILNWTFPTKIDLSKWPVLKAYYDRVASRPAVQAAMKAEGLIK